MAVDEELHDRLLRVGGDQGLGEEEIYSNSLFGAKTEHVRWDSKNHAN